MQLGARSPDRAIAHDRGPRVFSFARIVPRFVSLVKLFGPTDRRVNFGPGWVQGFGAFRIYPVLSGM